VTHGEKTDEPDNFEMSMLEPDMQAGLPDWQGVRHREICITTGCPIQRA
jgi:hypothetical protein